MLYVDVYNQGVRQYPTLTVQKAQTSSPPSFYQTWHKHINRKTERASNPNPKI